VHFFAWWWWCLLFLLTETTISLPLYTLWVLGLPLEIEESTCDDADIRSLMVPWFFFEGIGATLSKVRGSQPPRQTTNVNPFAKMHHPRAPHSFSVSLRVPINTVTPLSRLMPISAQNTSIEPYLARLATHRPNLSWSHFSLTPRTEVLQDCRWRSVHSLIHLHHTKIINLIFHPPFSPSASPATFSRLLMRMSCWALARGSPRSR